MTDTSANNKRIAKNTLLLYMRMMFMMIVSLYTSRLVLQILGVEDYGIYNVVGGVVTMFTFINSAMVSSTQRYITFAIGTGDRKRLSVVFSTALQIHFLISMIILLLGETVGLWFLYEKMVIPEERMLAAFWVYQLSIISCIVTVMSVPYNADIVAHEKMSAFAYISIIEAVLKMSIVFLLVYSPIDRLILYSLLLTFVQLIIRYLYSYYCKKKFEESIYHHTVDKLLFKEMISFAGWSFFGSFAVLCCNQGVNILLNVFFGPVVNAARGIALSVQSAVNNFSANFQTAMNPQIIKTYANGEITDHIRLLFMACKFSSILLTLIALPILLNTEFILHLWLGEIPEYTVSFVQIMLLLAIWDSMAYPLATSVQATGKIMKYQITISIVIFLILPISYMVLSMKSIPEYALFVHCFFAIVAQFVRLRFLKILIGLDIKSFCHQVFLPIVFCLVTNLVVQYYSLQSIIPGVFKLLLSSVMSIILTCVMSYYIILNQVERNFAKGLFVKLFSVVKKIINHETIYNYTSFQQGKNCADLH